jgi:hypothetical protein
MSSNSPALKEGIAGVSGLNPVAIAPAFENANPI